MKTLSYLLVFGLGIIAGCLITECTHSCKECPEIREGIDSNTTVKRDTIFPKDTTIKNQYKPVPKDTIENDQEPDKPLFAYSEVLDDSNVTITVSDTTEGRIISKEIAYKLKVPLRIIDTVRIRVTKTVSFPVPVVQRGLFIGAEAGLSIPFNKFRLAPEVEYITKNGYGYSYNYDLLNGIHSVGVKKRIL